MATKGKSKSKKVALEDVRLVFRNFSGRKGLYNKEGDRNFCVILSDEDGDRLKAMGLNVKYLKPREDEGEVNPTAYIKVNVRFDSQYPPSVVLITTRGKTFIGEHEALLLDWSEITHVDMTFNASEWTNSEGRTSVTAYLNSIYVTIEEDKFEQKYGDVPDSGQNTREYFEDPEQ